jgi:sialate O-acetylesterase
MMTRLFIFLLICFSGFIAKGQVRLPHIFGDHMVLQQNQPVRVWGWAKSGEKVVVILNDQKVTTSASRGGNWSVSLKAQKAGGPYVLTVKGRNQIVLKDLMIGEVWLCSGQSNMAFKLQSSLFAKDEIAKSDNPGIRQFTVSNRMSASPAKDLDGGNWQVSSPETSGDFSAVAYYYAKKLSADLHITVGIINASWGGTFIESWMSYQTLHALADYSQYHELAQDELDKWFVGTEKKYDQIFHSLEIANRDSIEEDSIAWRKPEFDDSKWLSAQLPQKFDYELLPRFDGVVWFRREINIPEEVAKKGITIHLGRIDDYDITYLNGEKVGSTMGVYALREYEVQPEKLKAGKNMIAIRVLDYWERGGFLDPASEFRISSGSWEVSLAGEWKMTIAKLSFMWIRTPNVHPNLLFNAMLSPIRQYSFKGAIWYQGENNVLFASQYREVLPELIKDWRKNFANDDFPFYLVQLPNLNSINSNSQTGGSDWADLRESQVSALKLPNTGMVVTIDLGDSTNVHPKDKSEVARRLALLAEKNTYGLSLGEVESPMILESKIEGNKVELRFSNIGSGLIARNKYGYLKGFELAGADQKFHYAKAVIVGERVIVCSVEVPIPVAVRYAWSSNPSDANLYNKQGFPLAPFRTDNWPLPTDGFKYLNWIK